MRLWLGVILLLGCGEDERTLQWRLVFEPPAEEARVAAVEARIVQGGCDSSVEAFRTRWTREDGAPSMEAPSLEPGHYAFIARAQDAACNWFMAGCDEVTLPLGDGATVEVRLEPSTVEPDPACGDPTCPLPAPWDEAIDWAGGPTFYVEAGATGTSGAATDPVPELLDALLLAQSFADRPVTVLVRAGTHTTSVSSFDGALLQRTATAPLRILGEDGAAFDNPDTASRSAALYLLGASYLVVENLTFRGGVSPFRIDSDSGFQNQRIVLRDLVVPGDADAECIRVYDIEDLHVIGSETIGCEIGLRLLYVRRGWALGNTFRDAPGVGVSAEGASEDLLIHGNQLFGLARYGVQLGASALRPDGATHEALRAYVVGNVFRSVGSGGFGPTLFGSCDGCVIAHNTFLDPQGFLTRILQVSDPALEDTRNGLFVNNLIVFDVADVDAYVNLDSRPDATIAPETFTFGWNLFVPDDPTFAGFTVPSPVPPDTTSSLANDAGFVDPTGASGYRIAEDSPARGAGMAFEYGIFDPPDFRSVCFGSPPSIGAFEDP